MESSFVDYRDKTGVDSGSDSEIIDNSFVENSYSAKKKFPAKNQTVFVAESEESYTEGESEEENILPNIPKTVLSKNNVAEPHVISSSDEDTRYSKKASISRQSEKSINKVVLSSSEEDEVSPEIVPKRRPRPPLRSKSNDSSDISIIGRKKTKRMILMDSDTENSIVIEHNKHNKLQCLKDTPLKIDDSNKADIRRTTLNISNMDDSNDESEDNDETSESNDEKEQTNDEKEISSDEKCLSNDGKELNNDSEEQSDDDGPDEDQLVMSRATRMSIMGVIPRDDDSDDSDFIQSDEKSRSSSRSSVAESHDNGSSIHKSPERNTEPDGDISRISCSPFASPLHDVSNKLNKSNNPIVIEDNCATADKVANEDDVTFIDTNDIKQKIMKKLSIMQFNKENANDDDDVTIVDTKPEIIALSSDDEEVQPAKTPTYKKSPKLKSEESTSRRSKDKDNTLKQYLVPPSYPNQVVYVKKQVRENELNKLEGLKADLHNVKILLENMELHTLPDGGVKLIERLSGLEHQVRLQGDKVANMVVEPDAPTANDIANDGFGGKKDKGLSWDDIQKASNEVQPRMFGKQAMATHMAERNVILSRLRDLHESLASRPPDSSHAEPPRALRSSLMPHQLHALAWLRWRETQRPTGGILADDMGLGKTITMISLVLCDKEDNIEHDDDDDDDYGGRGSAKLARGGTLVVCPASLMQQWGGEVGKHCAAHALAVSLHHGAQRAQHAHRLAAHDLVLTTYNLLQRDNEKNGVLMKILWRRIILDEAHIVRNHKSATSMAVSALRGRRRWCLTGTPVQNKDLDLFALLKFLRCTPFDELTVSDQPEGQAHHERPIKSGGLHS